MMFLFVTLVVLLLQPFSSNPEKSDTSCDFESSCAWHWSRGFHLVTGQEAVYPPDDASNNSLGQYELPFIVPRSVTSCYFGTSFADSVALILF
jgi:hypothetical protein